MSLTQTYYVASTARSKLGREAGRADHNLRRLVGHANLLDNLMEELQTAEKQQADWFEESVRSASKPQPTHIQWLDTLPEEEDDDSSDGDDSEDGEDFAEDASPLFEQDELDMDFDNEELSLQRVPSQHSPPQLVDDDMDSSDEEDEVTSPADVAMELSEKEQQQIAATSLFDLKSQNGMEDYLTSRPIAAC